MTARCVTYVREERRGVVGAILPWNFLFLLTAFKLAPTLAAGCTFVHKSGLSTPRR